jgi:hypothetical protein
MFQHLQAIRPNRFNESSIQQQLNQLGSAVLSQQLVIDVFTRKHPELLTEIAG